MPVKMQLARIIISELTENQVIYLQEVDGDREFPILIGIFEATNIDRRVKDDYEPPRPLTHDLVVSIASALGATVESVIISELNHATYFAQLRLRKADGELVEIDSRPDVFFLVTHHQLMRMGMDFRMSIKKLAQQCSSGALNLRYQSQGFGDRRDVL